MFSSLIYKLSLLEMKYMRTPWLTLSILGVASAIVSASVAYKTGALSIYQSMSMMFSICGVIVLASIVSTLQTMMEITEQIKDRSAYEAGKLSILEERLMWLVCSPHELSRFISNTFFEWDREQDEGFLMRCVLQFCEQFSAAQLRQGLPSSLERWQVVSGQAFAEINENVHNMSAGSLKEYYAESLILFKKQRAESQYTWIPHQTTNQLLSAYKQELDVARVLMPWIGEVQQ